MADQYDVSELPVVEDSTQQTNIDMSKSVLSPDYRSRDAFGPQQIGGLIGGLTLGGVGTAVGGPALGIPASAAGAGIGGFLGETYEQFTKKEKPSASLAAQAGVEEAAWDLGGNLVLKALGKTIRIGADKLGFTSKDAPDANKAAEEFLQQYGSSLPASQRTGKSLFSALEGLTTTPATYDLFKTKEKEIEDALVTGSKDILKSLVKSPELDMALKTKTSSQYSSGQILQDFIKQGQDALSKAVDPIYKDIFTDKASRVSMFSVKQYADKLLSDPAALTKGQRAILEEMRTLPPQVDVPLLHQIRSRFLAENRDKYSSRVSSEKDSRAAGTISDLIKQFDQAMDFSANKTLSKDSLKKYRDVTKTYREGVQGLQTDAIQEALTKDAEDVGGYLFASGKETPILDLFKSVTAASKLSGKPSNEIIDSLRYGYLEAMVNTPENMLKFAKNLEQDKAFANTYNRLFANTPQDAAIKKMNEAAKLGLVQAKPLAGLNYRTATAGLNVLGPLTALSTGYAFLLTPEQQQKITDNLGTAAIAGGSLILSQRTLAKALLDPKGAKAISYLSTARDKLTSPTAFTKLVVEPLVNIISAEEKPESFLSPRDQYDVSNFPIK
jgi:hypothetical protein